MFIGGRVFVAEGGPGGLSSSSVSYFEQDEVSSSTVDNGDRFGAALAAGNFDGDTYDDLAIAAYSEDDETANLDQTGLVHVVYGSETGLQLVTGAPNVTFSESDVGGTPQDFDRFGETLAAGDFDGDGTDDLAIGLQSDAGASFDEGSFFTVRGIPGASLNPALATLWRQGQDGLGETPEGNDELGWAIATGRLGTEPADDLAVSAPGEDIDGTFPGGEGVVHVLFGSAGVIFADGFESGDTNEWSSAP